MLPFPESTPPLHLGVVTLPQTGGEQSVGAQTGLRCAKPWLRLSNLLERNENLLPEVFSLA